jgi:hypothetical protein
MSTTPYVHCPFKVCFIGLGLGLLGLLSTSRARAEIPPLPPEEQARVNKAIDLGVRFLKESRPPGGIWEDRRQAYPVGFACLPGLTLLECGVPATDPAVAGAARYVRREATRLDRTYELSLAILFLDRLGDEKDKEIIRGCAVRLIAGQSPSGGWGYRCPVLSATTRKEIQDLLKKIDDVPPEAPLPKDVGIPKHFKRLTVFRDVELSPGDPVAHNFDAAEPTTDNSNTQFALLALWKAQKYDIPAKRTLHRMVRRFQTTQHADGSWGYWHRPGGDPERPPMDCVGLLGVAVGHGLNRAPGEKGPADKLVKDPQVVSGFVALSRYVGEGAILPAIGVHYYFLWSVERVGVLYDLPRIGEKDWYRWGASIILANQGPLGSFDKGYYPGSNTVCDTCFALLFLKRVNLVPDLAEKLPFHARELTASIIKQASSLPTATRTTFQTPSPGSSADPVDKGRRP